MKKIILSIILVLLFSFNNNIYADNTTWTTNNNQQEEVKQLKLKSAEVIAKDKIKLSFDKNIDKNSDKDISIRDTKTKNEDFITNFDVKDNTVILSLEQNLKSNTEYEVIIFSIMWENWATITSGLDWAFKFTTWDLSIFDKKENTNSWTSTQQEQANQQNKDLNSAWLSEKTKKDNKNNDKNNKINTNQNKEKTSSGEVKQNSNLAGKEVNEEIKNNTEEVAAKADKLAKTWPEHILLIFLSLLLAGLIAYAVEKRKKWEI